MHNEFLDLGGEKISKSKGHTLVLDDLVERGFEPLAYRYFFLQAHYRQQQAFSWEEMEAAATGLSAPAARGRRACARRRASASGAERASIDALRARFRDAVRDDLNAPRALAVAWEVARSALSPAAQRALLLDFDALARPRSRDRGAARTTCRRATRASTRSSPSARPRARRATSPTADRIRDAARRGGHRDRGRQGRLEVEARAVSDAGDARGRARESRRRHERAALPARLRVHAAGRPAARDRRAGRGSRARRSPPDAARRHRQRQDVHDRLRGRAGEPADAGDGAEQDAGGPALRRVQVALPGQRRRVLRLLLRLLPARGLHPVAPTPTSRRTRRSTTRSTSCATRPPTRC